MPRLSAPLAAIAAMTLLAAAAQAKGDRITLAITSPAGATPFTASCTVTDASGARSQTYEKTTPVNLAFEGARRLSCQIESDGTLEVTAKGPGGNVSRSRTSGGTVTLNLGR